ncbi:MAG: hypothetical protein LLF83_08495 [Methanobacterium sp.]|nr:hypothetical protein [Methanobacterium sp.]
MDDRGFIFTADAILGLIVVFIITASIVTYAMLPIYQGQDHQHLEALADSALETMEQTGTLRAAAVDYSNNNTTGAVNELQSSLNILIPSDIGYRITVGNNPPVTDNRGIATSNDVVTKVKVISGPQEGWMGRAYYKIEKVNFTTRNINTVTTVWNFHNYLTNFNPWNGGNQMAQYQYWGGPSSSSAAKNITFSIPSNSTINSVQVLYGSTYEGTSSIKATNTSFYLNGVLRDTIDPNEFLLLFNNGNRYFYNNKSNYNSSWFNTGNNTFYLKFNGASANNDMPWFSILANYTTTINVAQGVLFDTYNFNDIAGVGRPQGSTGLIYYLDNGTTRNVAGRTISWNDLQNNANMNDMSTPFTLTNIPGKGSNPGSAVGSYCYVNVPVNNRVLDAYVVLNAFGAMDGAIVQVKTEGGNWETVFTSFNRNGLNPNTGRSDGGYGNIPGIISLHDTLNSSEDYLRAGNNTVRIIIWDDVPSTDYDLVGLENSYTSITYTQMPIRWDTISFDSYQSTGSTYSQTKSYSVDSGAEYAYLFMGLGLDTRNVAITVRNNSGNSAQIYSGSSTYVLDLAPLDTNSIFTTVVNGTRKPKAGNYNLTVTVTPSAAYESGDFGGTTTSAPVAYTNVANPEIFSGTRIAILYPQFLANIWSTSYASDPDTAKAQARVNLIANLTAQGFTVDTSLIKLEALFSGDVPNAIPVRLELWKR